MKNYKPVILFLLVGLLLIAEAYCQNPAAASAKSLNHPSMLLNKDK